MLLKKSVWILGILMVLTAAGFTRRGAFWEPHVHPVETAYTILAMKMGTQPSLRDYQVGGVLIRRRGIQEAGEGGRTMPVITPLNSEPASPPAFDAWPPETNPFQYKPPMFPSLLAYNHHRILGPRFAFYPLLAGEPEPARPGRRSGSVFEIQAWAVMVPYLSGLLVILLTFALGWRMAGPGAGLLAATLTAAHPYQIHISSRIWPEAPLTVFLLVSAGVLHFFVSRRSWAGCFAAGLAFALAALTDSAALFALPAFWVWTAARSTSPTWYARIFNAYIVSFAAGVWMIGSCWPGYVSATFGQSAWTRAAFESSGWTAAVTVLARSAAGWVIFCPPLLAAARPKGEVVFPALIALSLVLTRWIYHPQAPWDERVWAVVVPFAAIASAPTVLSVIPKSLRKEKIA